MSDLLIYSFNIPYTCPIRKKGQDSFESRPLSILIMSFVFIIVAFAESRCKGRRFVVCVKVGNVAEGIHSKTCDSFASFFCCYGRYGAWRSSGSVPEDHWRYAHQMAQKHTFQPEMAEENDGIVVCFFDSVVVSFSDITMFCEKLIKFSCDIVVFLYLLPGGVHFQTSDHTDKNAHPWSSPVEANPRE